MTPVLRTAAGAEIELKTVAIAPNAIADIDVREALATAAPELVDRPGSFGSTVYRFNANTRANIFAANMVQRVGTPIGFHFDEEAIESSQDSVSLEGIWWLPRPTASDWLIFANASSQPVIASLLISDAAGRTIQQKLAFGPGQTQRLDLREITQAARFAGVSGGVRVGATSTAGNLIASHIVFDESAGMSAIMKTFTRDPAEKPEAHTMRAPMMALTMPDPVLQFPNATTLMPQVFLRNATAAPLRTTATLEWHSATQRATIPVAPLSLASGEVRILNVGELTRNAQLPRDAYWATVVVKYQGRSGDLVPVAASFDASGRFGLQTPFSEGISRLWKGSMWHVDGRRNSLITTGNGGTEATRAAMTLFYNNGKSSYTIEKRLEPGEQIWGDVGEIIRNQIPDKDGKTIPPDVMMGSYELRDLDHPGRGYLYEGKLIIDKTWGHGYYGCAGCCGFYASRMDPNPMAGAITTGAYNEADAEENCEDIWVPVTDEATDWYSANAGVVTLNKAYSKFVGIGSTIGSANLALEGNIERNGVCLTKYFEPQNTQNTQPAIELNAATISTTQPGSIAIGQEATLSLNAGGPAVSSATWTVGGTTVANWNNPGPAPPAANFNQVSPTFYWVPGYYGTSSMPTSWNAPISVSAKLSNGQSASASANVTVKTPSVTVSPAPADIILLEYGGGYVGSTCGYATSGWCMVLRSSLSPPSGVSGNIQWVQVIDNDAYTYTPSGGATTSCSIDQTVPALDNSYPYATTSAFSDSPAFQLSSSG